MDRPDGTRCANCGVALAGLYCHACGQRHEPHIHSIGHFLAEAAESVTHADSRLWRTLLPLLFRPGFLTVEFFAGRRARYLPPIRLYLVLSVALFLVAGALPDGDGRRNLDVAFQDRAGAPARETADASAPRAPVIRDCETLEVSLPGAPWLRPRLVAACHRVASEGPDALVESLVHNLPRAMFLFLPLVAALMQLLYWRPRHAYVEHLLFLVHNHAAVFLSGTLLLIAAALLPGSTLLALAALVYYAWYLQRALRTVYGQGRALTLFKFATLGVVYLALGLVMLVATVVVSAVAL
ncbi:MAG: DUF3667 domain-containing protein [Steroidobacteraceae bacterium]